MVNREGLPPQKSWEEGTRGIIPFGLTILIKDTLGLADTIQYRTGGNFYMKFKDRKIQAFTGFLTNVKVPTLNDEDINCPNLQWFEKLVRANAGKSVCKGKKNYPHNFRSAWELFDDETLITHYSGSEFEDLIMETTDLDMNDIINLLDYYVYQVKSKCLPKDEADGLAPQFEMKITRNSDREVIRVECPDMEFVATKSWYKIILKLRIR